MTDIAQLFDRAANTKPETQDLADKVASWFVPAVSSIAIAVLVIWIVVTFKVMDYSASKAVLEAITYFVTTLTVACLWLLGSPSLWFSSLLEASRLAMCCHKVGRDHRASP